MQPKRLELTNPRGPPLDPGAFLVVAVGASAGGLDACSKFLDRLPSQTGMAFILVQHLDPTHASMMVELLAEHTKMIVLQAVDGMRLAPNHLYVIPPATDIAVSDLCLKLSSPLARHGARLPFDHLLGSLAKDVGPRAACVVLSGTGADGSFGLRAIKENGGLIVAQDPEEAGYNGMPLSAIQTGCVDLILCLADIPAALARYDLQMKRVRDRDRSPSAGQPPHWLAAIIECLRTHTAHDFTLYKSGTLQRRVERRMAIAAIEADDAAGYLKLLESDKAELELLAKDLLINVTHFFRDPDVFNHLAETIIPQMVRDQTEDQPLRIWIAGCSTGEETYSLLMLFREEMAKQGSQRKLQVFASDVDPQAVANAREGFFSEAIEADVSAERLGRFFSREDQGYRILPELRGLVVFAVHDVLADPPFSRLDLVSCRNLLIYLRPEAQARVISLFHFALREGGVLLLGTAETAGNIEGRFELISKSAKLYRHIGRSRPGEFGLLMGAGANGRERPAAISVRTPSRPTDLAELGRRILLENYAPAAILINYRHECLFFFGPTERYLRVAPGLPTHDLLTMAGPDMRTRLRSAIQRAMTDKAPVVVAGGRVIRDGQTLLFTIAVKPVVSLTEDLLLVCFVDAPEQSQSPQQDQSSQSMSRVAELERELDATRVELQSAIHNLELANEDQKAINEEALSVNEEYQSTNEELLTSKEELQSLNEELTALNSQLQETLERQRKTSDDLQNVLYSTEVATLFLDADLKIRFFTPATKSLFAVITTDLGRPLTDLHSLVPDAELEADAASVLHTHQPIEREIEAQDGMWFRRRILPYRAHDKSVEGVVITFSDITKRKHASKTLELAKQQAEQATLSKSRFLAAVSHDLRQPLQTLALVQGLLTKTVEGEREKKLLLRLDETLGAMTGMLNALLDINQIEAGIVRPEISRFPMKHLLERLRDEFSYHAQAKGLAFVVMPTQQQAVSDPRLLEQMIRNLLSNAFKYTQHGKVLLGCRQRGNILSVEIWDTGIGIPKAELPAIFQEYHQIGNAARERSLGLGLGLAIVQRLADLLGHRIRVQSNPGRGSVFAIDIDCPTDSRLGSGPQVQQTPSPPALENPLTAPLGHTDSILLVEDDPEIRELLALFLTSEGHHLQIASDGPAALETIARSRSKPDLMLADYNLPNEMNGLVLAERVRQKVNASLPVIILTGDISAVTLREVANQNCLLLNKPVRLAELSQAIAGLMPSYQPASAVTVPQFSLTHTDEATPTIFIVDDDANVREALCQVIVANGSMASAFANGETFLAAYRGDRRGDCVLIDAYLPGMSGLEVLQRLRVAGHNVPVIMITGNSDVTMAVQAMKAGAADFIEKPVRAGDLLASMQRALEQSHDIKKFVAWRQAATDHLSALTPRQRQIMHMVLAGQPSKNIAADLDISQRTVENHRASIMKKTGSTSLPALARLALAASWTEDGEKAGS